MSHNFSFEDISYLYGLFVTDGYISKNKQCIYLSIELNEKDKDLLSLIQSKCQSNLHNRIRNTNFKENYTSSCLTITEKDLIDEIFSMGFPKENKTINAAPPITNYSERDFWRGVIDGDGSLGIRKTGPYLSLTTKSEALKDAFVLFVKELTGFKMNVHRNKRDNIYNLTITSNNAKIVSSWLYNNKPNLCLERKYQNFLQIGSYELKSCGVKSWTEEEIIFLKTHTPAETAKKFNRTIGSVYAKKKRLKQKGD